MNKLPERVEEFLGYLLDSGKSKETEKAYRNDLELFFRYMVHRRGMVEGSRKLVEDIVLENYNLDDDFIKSIQYTDLLAFNSYLGRSRDNSNSTKARRIMCLKSLYKYLFDEIELVEKDIARKMKAPKIEKRNPKFMTLEETQQLTQKVLEDTDNKFYERDICIMAILLNCGIRLSELVGINISKVDLINKRMTVIGKGNKERTVYLNDTVIKAIEDYLAVRNNDSIDNLPEEDRDALFVSRNHRRLSNRSIQRIVKEYIGEAGLNIDKFSTHSMRHTAATLMHKYGKVDIRTLQKILGHESIQTTTIYASVDDEECYQAVSSMPKFM